MSNKTNAIGRLLAYGLAGVICVGAGIGVGRLVPFNQLTKAAPDTKSAQVVTLPRTNGGLQTQAIQVHGWWTVKVVDHGKVVTTREFENSLLPSGAEILNLLLSGTGAINPEATQIRLHSSTGLAPCTAAGGGASDCFVTTTTDMPNGGTNAGKLVLTGSTNADPPNGSGQIDRVSTEMTVCTNTGTVCNQVNHGLFTGTSITPIPVSTGQGVQVTVVISFS